MKRQTDRRRRNISKKTQTDTEKNRQKDASQNHQDVSPHIASCRLLNSRVDKQTNS